MELVYMKSRSGLHDETENPEFSARSKEYQDLSLASSEVQSNTCQINCKQPLPADEKKSRSCQSCHKSPCSCSGDAPHSNLYPALPAKMMILEFLIRSLRHPTRIHNVSDLDDLISDGVSQGSVNLGPSEKMVLDSLHALLNAKTRPKSPSQFLQGSKLRKTQSKSHIITQSEILKLISPETWETSSPWTSPLKKSTVEANMHEKMTPSCSRMASISSDQPTLSHCPSSLSAGLLQCIWKDGLPHFELSLDNSIAAYTANPIKVQDKALDYVYMLHSGEKGRKDWMGHTSIGSRLVGKMKVSSSIVLNSDKSSLVETEFVLYGSPDDYMRQMHSPHSFPKGKGLVKRVTEIMRTGNVSSSPKHAFKSGKHYSRQFDDLNEIFEGEIIGARESESALTDLDGDELPTNQEIAAIVVREQQHECRKEPAVGGWGLKFLEKAGSNHPGPGSNGRNRTGVAKSITAVVPRGYHGGATSKNSGPTGLIERWRSGGRCDCGGWDLGCPVTVLDNDSRASLPEAESQDSKTVELSIKGGKNNKTMVRLVCITEDLYILYFDSSLSPLQCFSTGIAIVHCQAAQLRPKL